MVLQVRHHAAKKAYIRCCQSRLSSCDKGHFGHFVQDADQPICCAGQYTKIYCFGLFVWFNSTFLHFTVIYSAQHYQLFMELGKESLQTRRNKHKPIMHDLAPTYLSDLIPTIVGHSNNYALRNADHIQGFRSNSNLFSDSFFHLPSKHGTAFQMRLGR